MAPRRDELLQGAIRYLTKNGVADASLRPIARALGTSARLLIFHFGSKEALLLGVFQTIQQQLQGSLSRVLDAPRSESTSPFLLFWRWATTPRNLPRLRLLYEVHFIALQNPKAFGRHFARAAINWVEIVKGRLPPTLASDEVATLCGAVFDGLLIETLTTGDLKRTTASLGQFQLMLAALHARATAAPASPGRTKPRVARASRPKARGRGRQ